MNKRLTAKELAEIQARHTHDDAYVYTDPENWHGDELAHQDRAKLLAEVQRECVWTPDNDEWQDMWETGCSSHWVFASGGLKDNGMVFCHNCGGKVAVMEDGNEKAGAE